MAREAGQTPLSESPLYIRWGPDRSPYAVELKLDLVDRLRHAISLAKSTGQEIGGILVGALPTPHAPTLRIEDIEFLSRRAEDGATFMLEGGGGERFAEARRKARERERSTVGLFRSHLRPGPLRPSLADRTLLAAEFKDPVYLLLLATGLEPFTAAFFVASNGPLPADMSVREFNLDPAEFNTLPEIEPEINGASRLQPASAAHRSSLSAAVSIVVFLAVLAGVLYYFNQSMVQGFFGVQGKLTLATQFQDGLLTISWNHGVKDLERSQGAVMTIREEGEHTGRIVQLGADELRIGSVVFEVQSAKGEVELTLPRDTNLAPVQAVWHR